MEYCENFFRYLVKVPNNNEGRKLIKLLKKYYNKDRYRIRVKGSTINKQKIVERNRAEHGISLDSYVKSEIRYRNNIGAIPLNIAKFLRIYIDEKYPSKY